ncbi:hypothetical protein V6N13_129523 [Hibiscus sabdariffa]|uniref:Uncharacterized protein n=1 Tax=Hibiscus sabdariffa TaxID=183260 RepID=A0ABR2SM96_9ROSI
MADFDCREFEDESDSVPETIAEEKDSVQVYPTFKISPGDSEDISLEETMEEGEDDEELHVSERNLSFRLKERHVFPPAQSSLLCFCFWVLLAFQF